MIKTRKAIRQIITHITDLLGSHWWVWSGYFGAAAVLHFGTALWRLDSFFPFPQALDFSSYYAAAWSIRLHLSPYTWSEELLTFLSETQKLTAVPPVHNSPPLWPMLLQPLTALSFPAAAGLWLFILLVIVVYGHFLLARTAGYRDWRVMVVTLPLTVTFGPLFLNLTLGQNGVFLLLGALLLGELLQNKQQGKYFELLAVVLWVIAVGAKIYPAFWIICLPFLQRWRALVIAMILGLVILGTAVLLAPDIAVDYWLDFLPGRAEQFSAQADIDDQSLGGFFSRVGRTNHFSFPGLTIQDKHEVTWDLPWNFSLRTMQTVSIVLLLLLGVWLIFTWVRRGDQEPVGFLYALVLFSLLPFPHMARYNHILALPAMAWLWQRGIPYRRAAIAAYVLFGLSRLNHLWAIWLPSPLGPIATGFGLFGVLMLLFAVSSHPAARNRNSQFERHIV